MSPFLLSEFLYLFTIWFKISHKCHFLEQLCAQCLLDKQTKDILNNNSAKSFNGFECCKAERILGVGILVCPPLWRK